jgi:cytochrome oxidase Cu insertion factor (SCO1/SenC/PrrC family)
VSAPAFRLPDQHGRTVSLSAYRGRVVVLVFLTTGCRACTLVAQQVRGALDELGASAGDAQAIFVSTDPRADRPRRVARFLRSTALGPRAVYLNGTPARLRPIWRAYRVPPQSRTAAQPATAVLLIDPRGVERVEFGLEQLTPEALAHDIRKLDR